MKATGQGRFLSGLRQSNAAGLHAHRPSRSELRRTAIEEEMEMSEMAVEATEQDDGFDDLIEVGPSDDDIREMSRLERTLMADKDVFSDDSDEEEYVPDPYDEDDDDYYDDDEYRDDD